MIFSWIRQLILILRYINHDLQKCIFEKYINRIFYDQYIKNVFKGKVWNIPKSLRDQFHLSKWEGKIFKKVRKPKKLFTICATQNFLWCHHFFKANWATNFGGYILFFFENLSLIWSWLVLIGFLFGGRQYEILCTG